MAKKIATTDKIVDKEVATRVLKPVSYRENVFYFFIGVGNFTGTHASSLADFHDKLKTINIESVNYHYSRQDFAKWIKETLCDAELSRQINGIEGLKGEELRREILQTVERRLTELKNATTAPDKK